jgi:thiosulfate/3-mercaptopyruvate sulfurtransferase
MLATTEWLDATLGAPDLVVVDMRWRGDGSGRALFEAGHIPGAVYLDWSTDLVDPSAGIAFTIASPDRFAAAMERSGIGDHSRVVAYSDAHGSGPFRLWWASRLYGHGNVVVLDGGLEKWLAEGGTVRGGSERKRPLGWTPAEPLEDLLACADDVEAARSDPSTALLDSRPPEQYVGKAVWFETGPVPAGPDGVAHTPRGDLLAGHVPGAINIPASELYREDFTMKPRDELRRLFRPAVGARRHRAITYCGVGVSASALLFALRRAGSEDVRLYDASWEEWGRDPRRPVARA